MRIVNAQPPLYAEIVAAFPDATRRGVVFSWGELLYVPCGSYVYPALLMHEEVHGARQASDIEGWWRRYIADPEFRLAEEIPAHRAEYQHHCSEHRDRNLRAQMLHAIAGRLSGPLYGGLIKASAARRLIAS